MKSMMKSLIIMPLILAGLLLSGCEQKPEPSGSTPNAELALDTNALATNALDANAPDLKTGQQIYTLYCSACHNPGEGHAGTMKLALLKGEENSVITERSDLNAEYIRFVVRDGLLEMAPFRPTDINDGELDSLIQYILSNNSPNK